VKQRARHQKAALCISSGGEENARRALRPQYEEISKRNGINQEK